MTNKTEPIHSLQQLRAIIIEEAYEHKGSPSSVYEILVKLIDEVITLKEKRDT